MAAFFYSSSQPSVYEAKSTILVQYRGNALAVGLSDFGRSEDLAATYRKLVTAAPFLLRLQQLDEVPFTVDTLRSMISATIASNPPVLGIRVRHADPVVAAATAQLVTEEFIDYAIEQRLGEIARVQAAAAAQGITNVQSLVAAQLTAVDSLSLLEPVAQPGGPVLPRTRQNLLLGVFLGFLISVGAILLLESMGDIVRSPEEINRRRRHRAGRDLQMVHPGCRRWGPREPLNNPSYAGLN